MKKFILGYDKPLDEHLTVYKTAKEADYNSEEWCVVSANTLKEAKGKYEETFLSLKEEGWGENYESLRS